MSSASQDSHLDPFRWEEAGLGIPMEGKLFNELKDATEFKQICEKIATVDYPTAVKGATKNRLVACMKKRITVLVQGQALLTAAQQSNYDFSDVETRKRDKVKKDLLKKNSKAYNTARKMLPGPNDEARDEADWEVVEHLFANAWLYGLTHGNVVDALIICQQQGNKKNGTANPDQKVNLLEKAQGHYEALMRIFWPSPNDRDRNLELGLPMIGRSFKALRTEDEFNAVSKGLVELKCPPVARLEKEPEKILLIMKKCVTILVQRYTCKKYMPSGIKIAQLAHSAQFTDLHKGCLKAIVDTWKPLSANDKEAMEQELVNHLFRHAEHFGLTLADVVEAFKWFNAGGRSNLKADNDTLLYNLADKADAIYAAIPRFQAPICSETVLEEEPTESDKPMLVDLQEMRREAEALYQEIWQSLQQS